METDYKAPDQHLQQDWNSIEGLAGWNQAEDWRSCLNWRKTVSINFFLSRSLFFRTENTVRLSASRNLFDKHKFQSRINIFWLNSFTFPGR